MDIQNIEIIQNKADQAAAFMKCFASPHRLMILCHLAQGEKSVSDLITRTGIPQTSMSQHLNKLKSEGAVDYRRDHRTLYYRITNHDVLKIMTALYDIYCKDITEGDH